MEMERSTNRAGSMHAFPSLPLSPLTRSSSFSLHLHRAEGYKVILLNSNPVSEKEERAAEREGEREREREREERESTPDASIFLGRREKNAENPRTDALSIPSGHEKALCSLPLSLSLSFSLPLSLSAHPRAKRLEGGSSTRQLPRRPPPAPRGPATFFGPPSARA